MIKILMERQEAGIQALLEHKTRLPVCLSFTKNWWIIASDWLIFWFPPQTNPMEKHAEPFRSEQLLFQALCHTSPVIFMSGFKREKSTGLSSKECSTATKFTLCFFPHFKTIKTAYLFLPVWTSSQLFGLLYNFPRCSEDTRLLFQYLFSDPAFQIHCTYASTHSAQGP